MQSEDILYLDYLDRQSPTPRLVRAFGPWQVLTSAPEGHFCLLLMNP